ncbi:hypothetical protein AB0912_28850 [Streptomyces sp. NPDC007084]
MVFGVADPATADPATAGPVPEKALGPFWARHISVRYAGEVSAL